MKKRMSKARQLMQIAYATYHRGEPDIAKDIFVLAMEDPSVHAAFAGSIERLTQQMQGAVASGDYERAAQYLETLKHVNGQEEQEEKEEAMEFLDEDADIGEEEEEEEASLSPGDFVEPPPVPELAPAQVASLVTLARKIKAGGHPDLALRITKALGL